MKFEYNPEKSHANLEKHGVDFEDAKLLWRGPSVELTAKSDYENRFAIIGPIREHLYTCIYTLRGDSIRMISCRRSREKERGLYEKSRS